MSTAGRPLTVLATLALGACSAVTVLDTPPPRYDYFNGDFDYATHKGAIVTEVVGNPFGIPRQQFQGRVLGYMQGQNRGKPADFVATGGDRTLAPYKVVAAFNMPPFVDGHALCKGGASLPPPQADATALTLGMAFCIGDQLKTDAEGRVAGVRSIEDPRFARLVRGVTEAMIPPHDGHEGDPANVVP